MGTEQLEDLYNRSGDMNSESFIQSAAPLGKFSSQKPTGFVGLLIVVLIIGIIGFGASVVIKSRKTAEPEQVTASAPVEETIPEKITPPEDNINNDNGVNMDTTSPAAPSTGVNGDQKTQVSSTVPTKNSKASAAKAAMIDVKKVSWEIPDYVSANSDFKQYFISAGKSLKLALMSDLLLATDPVYSQVTKVSITYDKDGNFKDSKILLSSGSSQVDQIVLQTVNQTLKSLKAPRSLNNNDSTVAILKIYY